MFTKLKERCKTMKLVIQRVTSAQVSVDNEIVGSINQGLCIFVGIKEGDSLMTVKKMAQKVAKLRIFSDDEGKMNLSVNDVDGDVLSVSQFTLYGDTKKGNRPSFVEAAAPEVANDLYEAFNSQLRSEGLTVATGKFQTDMKVSIENDGPVTIVMEMTE